jgi:translation initiation factor 3 subunit M
VRNIFCAPPKTTRIFFGLTIKRFFHTAIRADLLTGKLAQPAQTLRVTRATARVFGPQEWALLVKRLAGWRTGIAGVLDIVAAARRRNDAVAAAVVGTTSEKQQSETPGEGSGAAAVETSA